MNDKKDNNNTETHQFIVRGPKGEFDTSTPEGKAQLEGYLRALSENAGRLAHENDNLKRSNSRKYELVSGSIDLADAKKKAAQLRNDGASEEDIDNFWVEFNRQAVKQVAKGSEYDLFWADYKASRPDKFAKISKFDEDLRKKQIKELYLDRLQGEEDQFLFLDQLFEWDAQESSKSLSEDDEPAPYSPKGSKTASPSKSSAPSEDGEDKSAKAGPWDEDALKLINESFGFDE